ncbi:MAG: DNA-processing protein DprA [Eggerthellaceae bacterium]|nr:DNA-processing protein DprA [Eggerthellaceae bacterium]
MKDVLQGLRFEIAYGAAGYPVSLEDLEKPPQIIYGIGDPDILDEGLSIVGARKATPYGLKAVEIFAGAAARRGIPIVSGGALGCDSAAHMQALEHGAPTIVVLGGGCDYIYPSQNKKLFQKIIDTGGAIISEHTYDTRPRPYMFRLRNRIIAALSKATLIVEAGLPSGTFSTADEALQAQREVLVVPGSIFSPTSRGANQLLAQGATPVVDKDSFHALLDLLYPEYSRVQKSHTQGEAHVTLSSEEKRLYKILLANPLCVEEICLLDVYQAYESREVLMLLAALELKHVVTRFPDGRFGAT